MLIVSEGALSLSSAATSAFPYVACASKPRGLPLSSLASANCLDDIFKFVNFFKDFMKLELLPVPLCCSVRRDCFPAGFAMSWLVVICCGCCCLLAWSNLFFCLLVLIW